MTLKVNHVEPGPCSCIMCSASGLVIEISQAVQSDSLDDAETLRLLDKLALLAQHPDTNEQNRAALTEGLKGLRKLQVDYAYLVCSAIAGDSSSARTAYEGTARNLRGLFDQMGSLATAARLQETLFMIMETEGRR